MKRQATLITYIASDEDWYQKAIKVIHQFTNTNQISFFIFVQINLQKLYCFSMNDFHDLLVQRATCRLREGIANTRNPTLRPACYFLFSWCFSQFLLLRLDAAVSLQKYWVRKGLRTETSFTPHCWCHYTCIYGESSWVIGWF